MEPSVVEAMLEINSIGMTHINGTIGKNWIRRSRIVMHIECECA